jgi:proteasome accessory factor A
MPRDLPRVPKLCGADVELGNFILGRRGGEEGTGGEASRALLREIRADYADRPGSFARRSWEAQDWGRKYLAGNAGCAYIDLSHAELCLPEVLSAYDHVAAWHAMLRIAREALSAAQERLPDGETLHVLVNNSDGRGNSYGSHLDFLVTRRVWDNLFERKLHHLLWLASFQVSSVVYTGQGKVGAENDQPAVDFQLAQRADFFETLVGVQTTYHRPIVNARDEPLVGEGRAARGGVVELGRAAELARLHSIFFDAHLAHGGALLSVGPMQLILGLLEAERVDPRLILDDPVGAVVRWSHDPSLARRERLASGTAITAVELQMAFHEAAARFADEGGYDGLVPRAGDILDLWADTLAALRAGDLQRLSGRLDWVLKLRILLRALEQRPALGWTSPQLKHLDHLYASLDPADGLYWAFERLGAVERHVPESRIDELMREPPADTRAFTRAMLLRLADPADVEAVDWDRLTFRRTGRGYWPVRRTVHLDDPLGFTAADTGHLFGSGATLDAVLDALDAGAPHLDDNPTLADWRRRTTATTKGEDDAIPRPQH